MGFLAESEPLDWQDAIDKLRYVRDHGIEQFVHIYFNTKDIRCDLLRWGDEIEYAVCKLVGRPNDGSSKKLYSLFVRRVMLASFVHRVMASSRYGQKS